MVMQPVSACVESLLALLACLGTMNYELGHVDKRDLHPGIGVIQAGICDGDQLGTRPYVGRGMGVL